MSAEPQYSRDGLWWWSGDHWERLARPFDRMVEVPQLSPDGKLYWTGTRWIQVPTKPTVAPDRKPMNPVLAGAAVYLGWRGAMALVPIAAGAAVIGLIAFAWLFLKLAGTN